MKMAKKVLAVVLAALIAAAVFAGCSKDEKKTNAPAAEKVKVINIDLSDEVYALGVNKDDADLLAKTNEFIDKILEDGTFDEICTHYFGGGEPVRIMDLAENLIKLSNHTVEEIGIKIVGLRPGEKLYEELSLDEEMKTRQKTANKKIFVNQPMVIDYDKFKTMLQNLNDIDENNVREKLMNIVPNYHPSKND